MDAYSNMQRRGVTVVQRLIVVIGLCIALAGCRTDSTAQTGGKTGQRVLQVLHDFEAPWDESWTMDGEKRVDLNPFWRFIHHTGGDWGRMGPDERRIFHLNGALCAGAQDDPTTEWCGFWVSPADLARQDAKLTDLQALYPNWVKPEYQPRAVALVLDLRGHARLKVELKGPNSRPDILWQRTVLVDTGGEIDRVSLPIPETVGACKFVDVVLEPGAVVEVHRLAMELEFGDVPFPDRTFLYSYAKAAACYDPDLGICADRAHWPAEHVSSVSATGEFVLATAVAAELGFVSQEDALGILRKAHGVIASIPRGPAGLLPHFVENRDGKGWHIPPAEDQEFSSVDSAICWITLMQAAWILGDKETYAAVLQDIRAMDFAQLYDSDGFISHGFKQDGTRITWRWDGYGGETALAIILARLAQGDAAIAKMNPNGGRVFRGVGFIAEIASQLFPQFDSPEPDAVSGVNWLASRKQLLADQIAHFEGTPAGEIGVFGLSASEGPNGVGYLAQGPDEAEVELIAPHLILMTAGLREDPEAVYDTLAAMQERGLFTPLGGLVENVTPDLKTSLPMISSLNSGFECLGAQALLCRVRSRPNPVHTAALEAPELRKAMEVFYPPKQ